MADLTTKSGIYLPTTQNFEIDQIQSLNIDPKEKELLVRLYQYINSISIAVNLKSSAYYVLTEFNDGNLFFKNPAISPDGPQKPQYRNEFRKLINFGALPNTGTKPVPHGIAITSNTIFTHIYATASNTTGFQYIPIPYIAANGPNEVGIFVDQTNVYITTNFDGTVYDQCIIVLEYLQN